MRPKKVSARSSRGVWDAAEGADGSRSKPKVVLGAADDGGGIGIGLVRPKNLSNLESAGFTRSVWDPCCASPSTLGLLVVAMALLSGGARLAPC
jgi:hypothetical protein